MFVRKSKYEALSYKLKLSQEHISYLEGKIEALQDYKDKVEDRRAKKRLKKLKAEMDSVCSSGDYVMFHDEKFFVQGFDIQSECILVMMTKSPFEWRSFHRDEWPFIKVIKDESSDDCEVTRSVDREIAEEVRKIDLAQSNSVKKPAPVKIGQEFTVEGSDDRFRCSGANSNGIVADVLTGPKAGSQLVLGSDNFGTVKPA